MRKILLLAFLIVSLSSKAQVVITKWDFEADPMVNVNSPATSTGVGAASLVGGMATPSRNHGAPTGCAQVNGTGAWAIGDANPGTGNESSGAQFLVSTSGFQNIIVEFDQRISNGGTRTVRIQYTLDGTNWQNFIADATNTTLVCNGSFDNGRIDIGGTVGAANGDAWGRRLVNFSGITGANNNPNFGVRFMASQYQTTGEFRRASDATIVATGGTWRFDNVSVSGSVISSSPTISAIPVILNPFAQVLGTPSGEQSFSLSGSNLTGNVLIDAPTHFEVSLTSGSGFSSTLSVPHVSGTINPTAIYVRMNRPTVGSAAGDIELTSPGAALVEVEVSGTTVAAGSPNLFINEFMAQNAATIADENGEFDDWIEIFNPNSFPVNLAGYYISDDVANPLKYRVPLASSVANIPAGGFLLIWADNQDTQGDLHTNFGLSVGGEAVILTAPDGTTMLDSYVFGPQNVDISEGRNGDGNVNWVFFGTPTPNASNNPSGLSSPFVQTLLPFPNPSSGMVFFKEPVTGQLFNITGLLVHQFERVTELNLHDLPVGTYVLKTAEHAPSVLKLVR